MPDLPISGLPAITVPSNSYTVAAVSASVTSQMTLAQVAAAISSSFTASYAISASYAVSASYEINYETSSSYADTASFVTASNVYGPFGSNSIISASYAVSASNASTSVSASYATTASYAQSSSYATTASYTVSASYASSSESSSYALTASFWGGGSSYVPYTGATTNVNLGGNDLIADNVLISPAGYGLLAALSRDLTGAGFGSLVLKNGATGYLIPTSSLTVDRYYLLPDKSGTVALLSDTFPYTGSARITGSLDVTGSLKVLGSISQTSVISSLVKANASGQLVPATGGLDYTAPAYLSAYHTASMFALVENTPLTMSFSTTDFSYGGITISGSYSDKIKIDNGGIYNIQFSAQTAKTSGTSTTFYIWLAKNGVEIPSSNTGVTLAGGANDVSIPAWNFFVSASAGDYYQLMFAVTHNNGVLQYLPSGSVGLTGPAVPSLILTVNRIA